jgi:murein L,D-transpeptidase YcbB/YkuD
MSAMVVPSDQTLHFAADIYGHDATLERALTAVRQAP